MKRKQILFLVKSLITISLIVLIIIKYNISQIYLELSLISLPVFLLAFLISVIALYINSLKWYFFIPQITPWRLFKHNMIGQYYSTLFFGQLAGDAAKTYILGKGKIDAELITASAIFDKITGFTGLTGLFITGIVGLLFTSYAIPGSILIFLMIAMVLSLICLFILRFKNIYTFLTTLVNHLKNRIPWMKNRLNQIEILLKALRLYSHKENTIFFCILGGVIYQLLGCVLVSVIVSQQVGIYLTFLDWCWIIGILSVALLLPLTIGGIGIREGTLAGVLGLIGIPIEKALAFSFTLLGLQILLAIIGGLFEFRRGIIKLGNT